MRDLPFLHEDLTGMPLHDAWRERFLGLLTDGASADEAAQAMLSVAVTARFSTQGLRETARELYMMALMLTQRADQNEAAAPASAVMH